MSLILTLEEQTAVGFTGKVNFLKKSDGQYLGVAHVREGDICFCAYSGKIGKKALVTAIIHEMDEYEEFKYVVEPEIVDSSEGEFKLSISALKKVASSEFKKYKTLKKLRPPKSLHVIPNVKIFDPEVEMNYNNFLVLKSMTEYSKVEDIYKNTNLFEHEITECLVVLRKKGFVNVISKERE